VILATDGDFNVGTVDQNALETLVADQRKSGIALTTLGFGPATTTMRWPNGWPMSATATTPTSTACARRRKVLVEEWAPR
jgi:Ca-activated chloride channel family protein